MLEFRVQGLFWWASKLSPLNDGVKPRVRFKLQRGFLRFLAKIPCIGDMWSLRCRKRYLFTNSGLLQGLSSPCRALVGHNMAYELKGSRVWTFCIDGRQGPTKLP